MYCPLTPERIAQNDAAIAAYEAAELSGDPARYWPAYAAVEQRMNAEDAMCCGKESDRIRSEINRIIRERKARNAAASVPAIAAE